MKKSILKEVKGINDWVKIWSGRWCLNFDSHMGALWTKDLKISGKPICDHVVYFYHDGITDCWVSQREKDLLGKRLVKLVQSDKQYISKICKDYKAVSDEFMKFIDKTNPKSFTIDDNYKYWDLVRRFYLPHLSVKYIVDYLSPQELKKYLPVLQEARLYAEQTFRHSEDFFEKISVQISRILKYPKYGLLSIVSSESENYFIKGKLPSSEIISQRFKRSTLIISKSKESLFVGKEVDMLEKIISPSHSEDVIKGESAYSGKVVGSVRIVLNPIEYKGKFKKGDILITGMTRPEFLPFMKKSSGFVTDAGGILSHAAIMARELKKPCVIGTKVATRVFKDGDKVEVDANKGTVRKI